MCTYMYGFQYPILIISTLFPHLLLYFEVEAVSCEWHPRWTSTNGCSGKNVQEFCNYSRPAVNVFELIETLSTNLT